MERRAYEFTECFFVGTAHASSHLMQVGHSKMIGVVDDDGIRIGDVQSTFNDGGGYENIVFTFHEVQHDFLEFLTVHLAMTDGDICIGHKPLNHACYLLDIAHSIVDEEYLATTLNLIAYGVSNRFLIEAYDFSFNGLAVWWWGGHYAKVTCCHQGELQGSWDRCSG